MIGTCIINSCYSIKEKVKNYRLQQQRLSATLVMEAKWMTNMARFGSTAVQKVANIGFIYFALAFHVMMRTKMSLASW